MTRLEGCGEFNKRGNLVILWIERRLAGQEQARLENYAYINCFIYFINTKGFSGHSCVEGLDAENHSTSDHLI